MQFARVGAAAPNWPPIIVANFQKRLADARAKGDTATAATLLAQMQHAGIPTTYVPISVLRPTPTSTPTGSPYPYVDTPSLRGASPAGVVQAGDTIRFHGRPISVWNAASASVNPSVLTTPNRYGTTDGAAGFTKANTYPVAVDAIVRAAGGGMLQVQVVGFTYPNGNYQAGNGTPNGPGGRSGGGLFAAVPVTQVSHVWRGGKLLV